MLDTAELGPSHVDDAAAMEQALIKPGGILQYVLSAPKLLLVKGFSEPRHRGISCHATTAHRILH